MVCGHCEVDFMSNHRAEPGSSCKRCIGAVERHLECGFVCMH
jgi:hypothetical protein